MGCDGHVSSEGLQVIMQTVLRDWLQFDAIKSICMEGVVAG